MSAVRPERRRGSPLAVGLAVAIAVVVALLSGCGVPTETSARAISPTQVAPSTTVHEAADEGPNLVFVYLIDGDDHVIRRPRRIQLPSRKTVPRQHISELTQASANAGGPASTSDATLESVEAWDARVRNAQDQAILDALVGGPTPDEQKYGYTSALDSTALSRTKEPLSVFERDNVAYVNLPRDWKRTSLSGEDQRQVLAQIVYTMTDRSPVSRVSFSQDAVTVGVTGDGRLVGQGGSLNRADFADYAPADDATSSGS